MAKKRTTKKVATKATKKPSLKKPTVRTKAAAPKPKPKKSTSKANGKATKLPEESEAECKVQYLKRELKVKLTPDELAEHQRKHLEVSNDIEAQQDLKRSAVSVFNEKIKDLRATERHHRTVLNDQAEKRPVDCKEVTSYRLGSLTLRRLDTDEIVEERALTKQEAQLDLDYPDDTPFDAETGEVLPQSLPDAATGTATVSAEDGEALMAELDAAADEPSPSTARSSRGLPDHVANYDFSESDEHPAAPAAAEDF